jgi:Fic family protein
MSYKKWNWLQENWPNFTFNKEALKELEYQFSKKSGLLLGVLKHINDNSKDDLLVDILSNEAVKTSEIEGEYLNRESVQSSIKKNLGLVADTRKVKPSEFGISEMIVDLYKNYNTTFSHQQLFEWHKMITNGRRDLKNIGSYRTHIAPMQVVSERIDRPKVHFEAPPSIQVPSEMEQFIIWFNAVHLKGNELDLFPLVKAGIAHLYFVSIHPFEDGNGRIGRAIAEKSIAISLNRPTLILLSSRIEEKRKDYYSLLESNNKSLEITDWLLYFGKTILEAQENTLKRIDFIIEKTKFFENHLNKLNERQLVVIKRLFKAGYTGFIGGLSADNYKKIAKTSPSTATRDLNDLVKKQLLIKTGTLKSSRYSLNIKNNNYSL